MCEGKVRKWVRNFKAGRYSFGWEVLDYCPYSLDLTPSDFYRYHNLKHHLDVNHYNDNEVVGTDFVIVIGAGGEFFWREYSNSNYKI